MGWGVRARKLVRMPPPLPVPLAPCEHGLPPYECLECTHAEVDATADPRAWMDDDSRSTVPTDEALDPIGIPFH